MGDCVITKLGILSQTTQLFDPLGWMSPVVIRAKCIIQFIWLRRIGWDAPLPAEDVEAWEALRGEFLLPRSLRVPRWLSIEPECSSVEVHRFADASECAYVTVLYMRILTGHGAHVVIADKNQSSAFSTDVSVSS